MNTSDRFRILGQIIGYYFLLFLCQIGGELVVIQMLAKGSMEQWSSSGTEGQMALANFLTEHSFAILLAAYGILGVVLLVKKYITKRHIILTVGLKDEFSAKYVLWGILMGASGNLWGSVILELMPKQSSSFVQLAANSAAQSISKEPVWLEILSAVIIASIFEEIIFRGAIFSRIRLLTKPMAAVICQALIYASMFGTLPSMIYGFMYGMITGLAVLRTGSVKSAVIMHIAANAAIFATNPYYNAILSDKQSAIAVIASCGVLFAVSGYFYFKNNKTSSVGEER